MSLGKKTLALLAFLSGPTIAMAAGLPVSEPSSWAMVMTVQGGAAFIDSSDSQNYVGSDNSKFNYNLNGGHETSGVIGFFFGGEYPLSYSGMSMQFGLDYNYFTETTINGSHTVGNEPSTSTLYSFDYKRHTHQVLAMTKLFGTYREIYHPYVLLGLGIGVNRFSDFSASTSETGSINLTPGFGSNSKTSFSYSVGVGAEAEVSQDIRLGVGYRFNDLGKISSGSGNVVFNDYSYPASFNLSQSDSCTHEILFHFSYII